MSIEKFIIENRAELNSIYHAFKRGLDDRIIRYFFEKIYPDAEAKSIDVENMTIAVKDHAGEGKPIYNIEIKLLYERHQEVVKGVVGERFNELFARTMRDDLIAKKDELIIGVSLNLPLAETYYEDGCINRKGLFVSYENLYKNATIENFPDGGAFGIVFAVGKSVETDISPRDRVVLRGMPQNSFPLGGEIYHFITEYDIAAVLKTPIYPKKKIKKDNDE